MPPWSHFPHEADIGIEGSGSTVAEAFEQAAFALTAVITDPQLVEARQVVRVHIAGTDLELLFLDWINAVVYEMATRGMLFGSFAVTIADSGLDAELFGEPVDVARHQPAVEVKGATFTDLCFAQTADGCWVGRCVVDV